MKRKMNDQDKKKFIALIVAGVIVIVLILMPLIALTYSGPSMPQGTAVHEAESETPAWMQLAGGEDRPSGGDTVVFPSGDSVEP